MHTSYASSHHELSLALQSIFWVLVLPWQACIQVHTLKCHKAPMFICEDVLVTTQMLLIVKCASLWKFIRLNNTLASASSITYFTLVIIPSFCLLLHHFNINHLVLLLHSPDTIITLSVLPCYHFTCDWAGNLEMYFWGILLICIWQDINPLPGKSFQIAKRKSQESKDILWVSYSLEATVSVWKPLLLLHH